MRKDRASFLYRALEGTTTSRIPALILHTYLRNSSSQPKVNLIRDIRCRPSGPILTGSHNTLRDIVFGNIVRSLQHIYIQTRRNVPRARPRTSVNFIPGKDALGTAQLVIVDHFGNRVWECSDACAAHIFTHKDRSDLYNLQ